MNPIDAVLEIAKAEIGYLEKRSNSMLDSKNANVGRNNYTKYARDLYKLGVYNGNKQGHAWCDQWCDWCFIQAFGVEQAWKITGQQMGGCGAGCEFSARSYKNMDRWYHIPERGDQIFFRRHGTICHTGLVERVENNMVYTIEGNTSSAHAVVPNGGGVFRKCYPIEHPQIAGFGRPRYELVKEVKSPVSYEQFKEYMDKSVEKARTNEFAETLFHRRRYLPDINSRNGTVRGFAERNAVNAPIQGTAADIIKVAMVRIYNRFKEENLKSKMILQVHDELNFSVYPEETEKVEKIVLEEMQNAFPLHVPLIADAGWGDNWLEAH